ncbi:MAG: hypothetical protein ABIF85_01605 [Nanoarchaeota archaeon]|nr:hypothetical protein [Nanoarchaeota archaeon]MBU4452539.1 hypothetical protein [Nanoarchaeota archaeon]MCG2723504.1 hypothetical protein [archaeon]
MRKFLTIAFMAVLILISGCISNNISDNADISKITENRTQQLVCAQVITPAVSPSGECREFSTPCDVPQGWEKTDKCPQTGKPPIIQGVPAAAIVHQYEQPDGFKLCAILIGDENLHTYYLADCNLDYDNQKRDTEIYKGGDDYWRYKNGTIIGELPQDTCASAPEKYKVDCEKTDIWLDQKILEWKPVVYKPMLFGAMNNAPLNGLSYEFSDEYERAIEETGVDFVRMDIPKFSDTTRETEALANLSKLVKSAQSRGKKVMIGNNANGDKEYFGGKSLSWSEYSEKQKEYLRAAANIKPDYIAVILEPVVAVDPKVNAYRYLNFNESVTPKMWVVLVNETIDIIKSIDPNIKTAIGIIPQNPYDRQFFTGVLSSKIDIVGVDIYGISGFDATEIVLVPEWKASGGAKEFWIMETWAGGIEFEGSVDREWKKHMDVKWLKAMAYYSQKDNLSGINPFYSKHFFAYDSETIKDIAKFFNALKTNRTSTFYAYRDLMSEFKRNL